LSINWLKEPQPDNPMLFFSKIKLCMVEQVKLQRGNQQWECCE
jgi:hypothetical protein